MFNGKIHYKSPFSMGKSTISLAIFHSYFDITRGYHRPQLVDVSSLAWDSSTVLMAEVKASCSAWQKRRDAKPQAAKRVSEKNAMLGYKHLPRWVYIYIFIYIHIYKYIKYIYIYILVKQSVGPGADPF